MTQGGVGVCGTPKKGDVIKVQPLSHSFKVILRRNMANLVKVNTVFTYQKTAITGLDTHGRNLVKKFHEPLFIARLDRNGVLQLSGDEDICAESLDWSFKIF